jgi:hypothetical protein
MLFGLQLQKEQWQQQQQQQNQLQIGTITTAFLALGSRSHRLRRRSPADLN